MYTRKTVNVRLWGKSVPAYSIAPGLVYGYDDVAGHFVPVEHLLKRSQVRYVMSRTLKVSA